MGQPGLGLALSDGAVSLRALLCPAGRRHQTLLERAWQSIQLVRRWVPDRELGFVADSSFAALEWLALVARLPHVSVITRLRLDAALYDPHRRVHQDSAGAPASRETRPTLEAVLADEQTQWTKLTVDDWYGKARGRSRSPQTRRSGITRANRLWPSAGS